VRRKLSPCCRLLGRPRLRDAKADVDATDHTSSTPLLSACVLGRTEIVRVLLTHGADLKAHTKEGFTPLILASLNGSVEIGKLLLAP